MKKVVDVRNVSIKYKIGDLRNTSFKQYFIKKIKGTYEVRDFWANKDISFSLNSGDLLGIIGSNGSGKSTLLTAIAGVMDPSEGKIVTQGKIAAILELSAGFDEELNATENIFLRGAMLGYSEKFIKEKLDSIIEFAELEDFVDIPIKQFSSGMKSRLAFAVACLVDPDILIIDEVLSVGDNAFRKKSLDKMKEILKSGITGIIVSHSSDTLRKICNKILWLDHGKVVTFSSDVDTCINAYEEFSLTRKIPSNNLEIKQMSDSYKKRLEIIKKAMKK